VDDAELAARGFSRETRIRRDARGRWYEDGVPVTHPGVARAFDAWLSRAPDGRRCLRNALHFVYVEVEGPDLFVRGVELIGDRARLRLAGDRGAWLDARTLRTVEGVLYAEVEGLEARFDNAALMGLEPALGEDGEGPFLRLEGRRWSLRPRDDPRGEP